MSARSKLVWLIAFLVLLTATLVVARVVPVFAPGTPVLAPDEIAVRDLPREARDTLALIRQGGPYPYRKDGTVFQNRERLLPRQPRGYYTEYTVRTPRSRDRGARRIVAGGDPRTSGEYWYTEDHYQSFRRIRE
jgi:ribonuclease T1